MSDSILADLLRLLAPFNTRGVDITPATRFADDLALDSLSVMELVAAVEDHFDVTIPLNILPDIHRVGDLVKVIEGLIADQRP